MSVMRRERNSVGIDKDSDDESKKKAIEKEIRHLLKANNVPKQLHKEYCDFICYGVAKISWNDK